MPSSPRRRGPRASAGRAILPVTLGAASFGIAPLHAQRAATSPSSTTARDRWSVGFDYLHLGAAPIGRRAEPSMDVTLGRALGPGDPTRATRVEAGWLRASRVTTQAQGVTLGMSFGVPLGRRAAEERPAHGPALTLRPGAAVLAGWAEAQDSTAFYAWRGLPNTAYAGQTGTAVAWRPVRGRTTGAGLSLGADLRLTRAVAITGSVRQWAFTGPVIRPNRHATLAGLGVAVRPRTLAADVRTLWHRDGTGAPSTAQRSSGLRPTVPQDVSDVRPAAAAPAAGGPR